MPHFHFETDFSIERLLLVVVLGSYRRWRLSLAVQSGLRFVERGHIHSQRAVVLVVTVVRHRSYGLHVDLVKIFDTMHALTTAEVIVVTTFCDDQVSFGTFADLLGLRAVAVLRIVVLTVEAGLSVLAGADRGQL